MLAPGHDTAAVRALQQRILALEGPQLRGKGETSSTGFACLDRLLPHHGLRRGTLAEWLADDLGSGSFTLAYLAAQAAARSGKQVVISDRSRKFYAAVIAGGIPVSQLTIVRPHSEADELWAIDQSLRCPGVAAVWAELAHLHEHDFRRLQLAAEDGGTLGLLCRSSRVRGQPTWSDVQFLVTPQPAPQHRRWQVEVVRLRGHHRGGKVVLEQDDTTGELREVTHDETHPLPALPRVAAAASYRRHA